MRFRPAVVVLLALALTGCFQQEAPPRPVTATSVSNALELAGSVQFLDLHNQPAPGLPDDLSGFTSLTRLSLRNTGITELPPAVRTLKSLTWLDLGENQFAAFPDPALIPNMRTLYLSDNALTELPASIGGLKNLFYLNLDRNPIATLPPEIGNLPELMYLRLNGNKLTTVPDSLGQLKKLKLLYLKGNPLPEAEKQKIKTLLPQAEVIF